MSAFFFKYFNNMPKRFACLQNKFFRHFIPFLFNSNLKQTNIRIGNCTYFTFKSAPYSVTKGVKV